MNKLLALALLGIAGLAQAQQAGDDVVLAGWIHVHAVQTDSALHTNLRPSLIGSALGISDSFDSPGTSVSVADVDTLGISFAHFLSNHLSIAFNAGIPAIARISGHGVAQPTGPAGPLFSVDLGDPNFNPLGSARQWSPALALQYHFGGPSARIRPFLGAGLTYTWFTEVRLNPAFENELNTRVGMPLALAAGKSGPTSVSVDADPVWEPVFAAGVPVALGERWGVMASTAYVPFVTRTTVEIKAADGTVLSTSQPHLGVRALITGLLLTYRF